MPSAVPRVFMRALVSLQGESLLKKSRSRTLKCFIALTEATNQPPADAQQSPAFFHGIQKTNRQQKSWCRPCWPKWQGFDASD